MPPPEDGASTPTPPSPPSSPQEVRLPAAPPLLDGMPPPGGGAPTPRSSPPRKVHVSDTPPASKDAAPSPSAPQPAGSSATGGTGTSDAFAGIRPTSPGLRDSSPATGQRKPAACAQKEGGVAASAKEEHVTGSYPVKQSSSAPGGIGTGDAAAATPPSSLRASTPPASASRPTSPRLHCGGSSPMASTSPDSVPLATADGKSAASNHERDMVVASVIKHISSSDAASKSEKQNRHEADLDRREESLKQLEQDLGRWAKEVEQREYAAIQREKLSDKLERDKPAALLRRKDELSSRLAAKEKEEEDDQKKEEDDQKEEEDDQKEKGEGAHGCFGSKLFHWKSRRGGLPMDEASVVLKQQLLMPQHSKPMPIPFGTPNPVINETTTMILRTSTPNSKVFETRFMVPGLDQSSSESNDPEMVKICLRVFARPSDNLDERRLLSTMHETLKVVVAQYNASQFIASRERVRLEIRDVLTERAQIFGIAINDVSIVSLSIEKEFTPDIEEEKQDDDQIWNKRQIGYIFDLGTSLGIIFLIRPWLPSGYDRWILGSFAAAWGVGSVGLPIGMFGTSRFERDCSRHVGRFISISFSLLVIYAIYILTLNAAGTPSTPSAPSSGITESDGNVNADWWTTVCFSAIAVVVFSGHLFSWIRGCCTGGDRDTEP